MRKRCIAMYMAGMVLSFLVIFLTAFVMDYFYIGQKSISKGSGMEYWTEIFEKHQAEIRTLENYYNRIKNWDFARVHYRAKDGLEIEYKYNDGYLQSHYVTELDYVLEEFFELSLKNEDLSYLGYKDIYILGDYCKHLDFFSSPRILSVITAHGNYATYYVYSPLGFPSTVENDIKMVETKSLGNDWYCITTGLKEGVVICY